MPLHYSAAYSSRITKPKSKPKSPFAALGRKKSTTPQRKSKKIAPGDEEDDDDDADDRLFSSRLEDLGLITALATDLRLRDVAQQVRYIQNHMFDEIPERAGMNSTRIAEVLNYRKTLPPIVTVAHVHALCISPTSTEREIAELVQAGIIRKIVIPGRGLGSSAIGESLVLVESWNKMVEDSPSLDGKIKKKYISALKSNSSRNTAPTGTFTPDEAIALIKAGFLTSPTSLSMSTSTSAYLLSSNNSNIGTLASLSTVGSRAAAGSVAAVGGDSAILDAGGGGSSLSNLHHHRPSSTTYSRGGGGGGVGGSEYTFSLPSIGPYLRLLESSRAHLVNLLSKSKFKEAPCDLLRERWDGSPSTGGKRREKGLAGVVLPSKTKKWRQFNGLKFQWVLEECLGTGLIEVFDTGSVGHGVRLA